ncbi:hypothetical protein Sta7437_3376 [Stanieria cyanosphaera PCC 7437]|uniref:Uncharacterized protein n=1 Tax=Stanieria cyanosphaera (strain ATCC 29371 / PCC 7437) TaxID=111780 RepID=K9XYY1_STAC7|nr:hypothetical protein [Stanieria cyanosphaera]AFZ36882.1 hypothetical protein Sta7437_3376 [Stanieria cyanosphaera PCC 7437]
MSLLSKINFRRILVVFLVQITLFLGLALGSGNNNQAFAEVINRKAAEAQVNDQIDEAQYESAKASRREEQAKRSEQAAQDTENETIAEKLNLEELNPENDANPLPSLK